MPTLVLALTNFSAALGKPLLLRRRPRAYFYVERKRNKSFVGRPICRIAREEMSLQAAGSIATTPAQGKGET